MMVYDSANGGADVPIVPGRLPGLVAIRNNLHIPLILKGLPTCETFGVITRSNRIWMSGQRIH